MLEITTPHTIVDESAIESIHPDSISEYIRRPRITVSTLAAVQKLSNEVYAKHGFKYIGIR